MSASDKSRDIYTKIPSSSEYIPRRGDEPRTLDLRGLDEAARKGAFDNINKPDDPKSVLIDDEDDINDEMPWLKSRNHSDFGKELSFWSFRAKLIIGAVIVLILLFFAYVYFAYGWFFFPI